ncbi:MAG: hypothetical protein NW224_15285 [Leptolyngbyaceae cyanobacterium bins.302]|nr:hypothetical protein [Leptolyngbyaceae cyanobacterium bins.302]
MLTDPETPNEQPLEYEEPILASSLEEAQRICRTIAERDGVKLKEVQAPAKTRKDKNQRYICVFESNPTEW